LWPGIIARLLGWQWVLDDEDVLDEDGEEDVGEDDGDQDWQDIEGQFEEEDAHAAHADEVEADDDVMDAIEDEEVIDDVLDFWKSFPCLVAILGLVIVDFLTTSSDSIIWAVFFRTISAAVGLQLAFMAFTFNHGMLHWNAIFHWDDFRTFWWWPL